MLMGEASRSCHVSGSSSVREGMTMTILPSARARALSEREEGKKVVGVGWFG